MSIIRVAARRKYTVIDRRAVNDDRLTFRARGMLTWLLDKPDDWTIDRETLARAGPDGLWSVREGLKELRQCGYLVRESKRLANGQIVTESVLYEVPREGGTAGAEAFPEADLSPILSSSEAAADTTESEEQGAPDTSPLVGFQPPVPLVGLPLVGNRPASLELGPRTDPPSPPSGGVDQAARPRRRRRRRDDPPRPLPVDAVPSPPVQPARFEPDDVPVSSAEDRLAGLASWRSAL